MGARRSFSCRSSAPSITPAGPATFCSPVGEPARHGWRCRIARGPRNVLELSPFCPTESLEQQDGLAPLDRLFETKMNLSEWPRREGDWRAWLLRGGFPPALAAASDVERNLWYAGYVQTYLERDLRRLSAVASLPDFQRLMALATNRAGRLLNQSELGCDAAMAQPTVTDRSRRA